MRREVSQECLSNETADRAIWVYGRSSEAVTAILDQDAAYTAYQKNSRPALLAIKQANGLYVEDHAGLRYMDLHGNNCHHIGYQHPKLVQALMAQLGTLTSNVRGFTNDVFPQLAKKMVQLWPGRDGKFFMVPGGASANELALAIARVNTNRYKSITFDDSFHGRSFGAISLTGAPSLRSPRLGPLLPGAFYVPSFRTRSLDPQEQERTAGKSLNAIRRTMETEGDIACFVAEPMTHTARRPPDWYWPEVRHLCDQHGVLLIFDEVPTGLGKTGAFFNSEQFQTRPDITVLGKALGGSAMPVAAVIADGALDAGPELNLGYFTHEKNPLMARAALTTLEIIEAEGLVNNAKQLGAFALDALEEVRSQHQRIIPTPMRGQGMMVSFDVASDSEDPTQNEKLASTFFYRAMENGLIINYPAFGSSMTLSFPLVSNEQDVAEAGQILDRVLGTFK